MAKVINKKTGQKIEVKDGEPIREACKNLGVPFACEEGICGSCMIDIIKGKENLTELTENEKYLDRDEKHRLACQCKIKKGEIEIDF